MNCRACPFSRFVLTISQTFSHKCFRAAKDSKKTTKPSTSKKPAAAAPKNAQKKAATKGKQPMQKAAPRVGGKR